MTYLVKEIFYTLQGEGYWTGRPAVFCRFSRCNLWSGREADRAKSICSFCDTDFVGGDRYTDVELARAIKANWKGDGGQPMVVFTGGEPALQLDDRLLGYFGPEWYVAVETNGTLPLPDVDWKCVSPKTPRLHPQHTEGDELKLVYPQAGRMQPETYAGLEFNLFWLSPMDGQDLTENTAAAIDYVKAHPQWRLNTQTHKQIGIR